MKSTHKIHKIEDTVWAIEDVKSSEEAVAYLVVGSEKALVFDTGLGLTPLTPLIQSITSLPLVCVLSHWHFDHTGGAHEFGSVFGWKSPNMIRASQHGTTSDEIRSFVDESFVESIGSQHLEVKKFPDLKILNKEQTVDIGKYRFEIVYTPGHTEDSICLYERGRRWLFSGDTAYHGEIYLQFDDSNANSYEKSISKLVDNYKVQTIFTGHNSLPQDGSLLHEIQDVLRGSESKKFPLLKVKYDQ